MAVRSTVGDSLANLGNELLNYRSQMQRTRANDLALNEAQRQTDRRDEQELMAVIEQAGNYRIDPTDTSGALFQYDFGRIAEERPDIAKRILNADPRFNIAVDERGRKIQTEVDSFVKNDDGTYSVLIKRPDGRRAPITENRTAAGNDVVAKFTVEDFNRIGSNYLGAIVAKGAGENASTFLRDAGQLTDAYLRNATLDNAANSPLANDPGALSQFWGVVNRADSSALEQIAADFGVDVAGLKEKAQQQAPEAPANEQNTPSVRGPISARNRQPMTDEQRANSSERLDRLARNRERQRQRLLDNIDNAQAALDRALDSRGVASASGQRSAPQYRQKLEAARKALEDFDARVARMGGGPAIAEPDQQAAPQATPPTAAPATAAEDTSPLPESGVTPPVSLNTRDQVLKALQEQLAQPSDEQLQQMSRYLQSKGVQRASDLRRLPSREAHMAAWLMASRQGGTTKDRVDLANKLLNYVDTGSQEVNRPEFDYQQERVRQMAAQTAAQQSGIELSWRKFFTERAGAYNDAVAKLFDERGAEVLAGVVDEDGDYQTPTAASTLALNSMIAEASRLQKGTEEQQAAAASIPHFLLAHVRGFVAGKEPGFFDIADKIDNWVNEDGRFVVGDDSKYLRLIKDSRGNVVQFKFVHPDGNPEYDFAISRYALQKQYSPQAMEYLIALAEENSK